MAVLPSGMPNIGDLMKSLDPNHKLARAANLMSQANELVPRLPVYEANEVFSNRVTQIVALGAASERAVNEGTQPTKHEKAQHSEGTALVDKWNVCDRVLAEASGNVGEYRAQETRLGTVSVSQRVAYLTVKGNQATSAKQFTGFIPRYNTLQDANVAQQIVDCGGTAALSSMFLIRSGPDSVFLHYSRGSKTGGLFHEDFGLVPENAQGGVAGAHMAAYKDQIGWNVGLTVKDQRCVVRLANIASGDFTALTGTQAPTTFANLPHKMMVAHGKLPIDVQGHDFWVCNRTVRTGLLRLAYEKSVAGLGLREGMNQLGMPTEVLTFWNIPIYLEDQITNDETQVT